MSKKIVVALAGNPNAGKTTLFNALTGARQHVGNWPGVTVEKKEGTIVYKGREIHVVDLPGTYSLTAYSLEEIIARNFIVESAPDVVVDVVDASNLERNLYLSVQLLEMGAPIVIALNMIDVAQGRLINIDDKMLSDLLGVPIIPTNGKKRIGIEDLLDEAIERAETPDLVTSGQRTVTYGTEVEEELAKIEEQLNTASARLNGLSNRWLSVKLLEGDSEIAKMIESIVGRDGVFDQVEQSRKHIEDIFADPPEIVLTDARYGIISGAVKQAVQVDRSDRVHLSESIDKVLTDRMLGPVVLMLILYLVYMFTFQASDPLVKGCQALFHWLGTLAGEVIPEGLLRSLVVSGIINGVGGVLGFTPLIAFMFLAIAILEDTGYMARIAFMLDRVLRGFGLHGSSMLALMVAGGIAGGCAVPGIMATRTMKEPKERLVTILVSPLMNCGAKLPVYALLIAAFFAHSQARIMILLTLISWAMVLTAAKAIRSTVLTGPSAPFVLELPPYRVPTLRGLVIHTWERTWMYIKKAGTILLAVSIVLWAMMTFPTLSAQKAKSFNEREAKLTSAFVADPVVGPVFKSEKDVEEFEKFMKRVEEGEQPAAGTENPTYVALAEALTKNSQTKAESSNRPVGTNIGPIASAYSAYAAEKTAIEGERLSEQLKHTIGGRLGVALETVFRPIGFDWKTNVALVGGFAAKEVVVATLGTAYSLGEVKPREAGSLVEKLRKAPGWNPLTAFTLIVFVMLYNPCIATLVVIKKESGSWRWTFFAMAYTTILAYCVALAVHWGGTFLRLGLS
jgi:ferrous iron transport protein B